MQGPVIALRPFHGIWRILFLCLSVLSVGDSRHQCFDTTAGHMVDDIGALPFIRHVLQHILLLPVSFLKLFPEWPFSR